MFWTTVKVFAGIPTLSQNGGVGREIPANVKTTVHMSHTPCSQVVSIIVIMSRRTVRVNEHEDTREYMRVRSNTRKATAKKRSWNLFRRCREKWRIPSIGVDCRVLGWVRTRLRLSSHSACGGPWFSPLPCTVHGGQDCFTVRWMLSAPQRSLHLPHR